jgi:3-hydroxyacyl-CoA dehydrogenase
VEVKIGVQYSPRELVLDTSATAEDIDTAITEALGSPEGVLRLSDDKGRTVIVPAAKLAYVEYQDLGERRIGFTG